MRAFLLNRYPRFLSPVGTLVSRLGLGAVFLFSIGVHGGDGVAPRLPEPKVKLLLDTVRIAPGDVAELTLSVSSNISLKMISVAINFDETKLRIESIERILEMDELPEGFSTTNMDNRDDSPGEQATEGWVHLELTASTVAGALDWPLGDAVPLYRLRFRALDDATDGFSPVGFTDVGPEDGFTVLGNSVKIADSLFEGTDFLTVPQECLNGGGIMLGLGEIGFFLRGDSNVDGFRDLSDAIYSLSHLFQSEADLLCEDSADSNDDGLIDLSDPIFTLCTLYQNRKPHPEPDLWGPDPTYDTLCCEVTGGCSF